MSTAKKPHGHYCRICEQYKANEKFSGRGHAAHICKACAKRGNKPPEIKADPPVFIDNDDFNAPFVDADNLDLMPYVDNEIPQKKKRRKPSKEKMLRAAQKKQAKAFLSEMLANDDINKTTILEAAARASIPTEALHRAKGSLGIRAIATETGSVWHLPKRNKKDESEI